MRHGSALFVTLAVAAGLCLPASDARADIVKLTNGRTMRVDSARFEGDVVILMMHGVGQIRAPKDLIDEFLPEDTPWAHDAALEALARDPTLADAKGKVPGLRTVGFGDGEECPKTAVADLRIVA